MGLLSQATMLGKMAAQTISFGIGEAMWTHLRPDLIVGKIPLYGVQNIEVSRSNEILKYRAVRGEFMAHQHGGYVAVRIDGKFFGEFIDAYLMAFEALQIFGEGHKTTANMGDFVRDTFSNFFIQSTNKKQGYSTQKYEINDFSFLETVEHKTFNVFSRHEILFDMYLETFIWAQNVKEGPKVLNYTLLLRHYKPAPVPQPNQTQLVDTSVFVEDPAKHTVVDTNKIKREVLFYDQFVNLYMFNMGLNLTHRLLMTAFYVYLPSLNSPIMNQTKKLGIKKDLTTVSKVSSFQVGKGNFPNNQGTNYINVKNNKLMKDNSKQVRIDILDCINDKIDIGLENTSYKQHIFSITTRNYVMSFKETSEGKIIRTTSFKIPVDSKGYYVYDIVGKGKGAGQYVYIELVGDKLTLNRLETPLGLLTKVE